ncbi:hypothetical protein PG996_007836 [Apiospora saccharicola]|uniref:Uncharacterized protein n=1 Tax=Apiospora saccharicola TaxID=335842 RepID=A0ABR1UZD4_9PEZI
MFALTFWFLAALVSTLVSGAAVSRDDSGGSNTSVAMPGITWRGNITVDGPIYEFNGTVQVSSTQCDSPNDDDWGYAVGDRIIDGINYLRGLTGDCGVTPGPCGRVSCSWDSAISWCWDNPTGGYTTKCSALADYAQAVMDHCPYRPGEVWGTAFSDAGFSVQVAGKVHLC